MKVLPWFLIYHLSPFVDSGVSLHASELTHNYITLIEIYTSKVVDYKDL